MKVEITCTFKEWLKLVGNPFPNHTMGDYVGTVQMENGLVWHVYIWEDSLIG